jgi:hypothetical protein
MNEIVDIYDWFLRREQQVRDPKFKNWFRASSAGSCFKKQWFNINEYEQSELDERVMRLLRLGTIVHADIETAVNQYVEHNKDVNIITESEIEIPELKVVGHLDIATVTNNDDEVSVDIYDVKTCASYKWRMKFGRNREKNPSFNYELQVGTYGLGIQALYDTDNITLSLLWYNKDTSAMRKQEIDAVQWTSAALEYWTECTEALEGVTDPDTMMPGLDYGVPMMDWECRYCGFTKHCKGI